MRTAIIAVSLWLAAILFYIWLRFEWQFSLGAVAALFHDVVLTIGIFAALQIRFDLATIAALLTIVGYSINDTVIVFDRVRENLRKYKKMDIKEVLNLSINETLSRTLMTSGTTLLALIALADMSLPTIHSDPLVLVGVAFVMGLQNAATTRISDARVRTTHVTGISTDIGVELAILMGNARSQSGRGVVRDRLVLHLATLVAFLVGGIGGVLIYGWTGAGLFLLLALALPAIALPEARRARSPGRGPQNPGIQAPAPPGPPRPGAARAEIIGV